MSHKKVCAVLQGIAFHEVVNGYKNRKQNQPCRKYLKDFHSPIETRIQIQNLDVIEKKILLWRAASLRSAPQAAHIKTSLLLVRCRR